MTDDRNLPDSGRLGVPDNLPTATPPAGRPLIRIDDTQAAAIYANFCRVTGTPEEVVLDLALNVQPLPTPGQALVIGQRVVMNYFTAKRMLSALAMTIERHEAAFGRIEADVQKRLRRPAGPTS
ncbi:MAG: DUF3467 domain-containing protein [Planctomycetia bacterium]|nr:DUF3467 domain-containing protein [Planctomycetia bacterium]